VTIGHRSQASQVAFFGWLRRVRFEEVEQSQIKIERVRYIPDASVTNALIHPTPRCTKASMQQH
jgi:hypothetical protein